MKRSIANTILLLLVVFLAFCSQSHSGIRTWTSPGDDGNTGYAAGHEMVWSLDSAKIVASDAGKRGWSPVSGVHRVTSPAMPTHTLAGAMVTVDIPLATFPSDTVVFMSVKAFDDAVDSAGVSAPNYSLLGNIFRLRTPDTVSPAAVLDLR
jgi:hypothetical protein